MRNLCGTFCFSMQFVVFKDLAAPSSCPSPSVSTGALIVNSIITPPRSFQEAIPLIMLLAAVLGLPALLILITTRKISMSRG